MLGWPELIIIAGSILGFGIPIWLAVKAKPLGQLPYRWGRYVGIHTGMIALALGLGGVSALGKATAPGRISLYAACITSAAAAVGVLLRKRWGVVFLFVTYGLLLLLERSIESWPALVLAVINAFYFKRRWRLMSSALKTNNAHR